MSERKFITLKDDEQQELSDMLTKIKAKESLIESLAEDIYQEERRVWDTIHHLYPEVEGKKAAYHMNLGKLSYDEDPDQLAKVSENLEQLRLLRKLRNSGKFDNDTMLKILEVFSGVEAESE